MVPVRVGLLLGVLFLQSLFDIILLVLLLVVWARDILDLFAGLEMVEVGCEIDLGRALVIDQGIDCILDFGEALGEVGAGVLWDGRGKDTGDEAEQSDGLEEHHIGWIKSEMLRSL